MRKEEMLKKVSGVINKASFGLKKHSPEILVVAGVIGTVASAVMACRATTKIGEILDESNETLDAIHKYSENPETVPDTMEYSPDDVKKDLAVTYVQTGLKIAKLYAPSVVLGGLSISAMLVSNNILRKRNVALAAAYATVDKGFKEYRERVVERFGEAVDRELRYNINAKEIEETVVDEKGKEKKVKKKVNVANINEYSDYARWFDSSNPNWEETPDYNLMFLKAQQKYANDKLIAEGRLFLNDVYEALGIPKTKAGQIVGWVYDPSNPDIDSLVDIGILDCHKENARNFVNGVEPAILLDFNCDGNVWDSM